MKIHHVFFIVFTLVFIACQNHTAPPAQSPEGMEAASDHGKGKGELNISDFGPCTVCEFEGKLVNPMPEDWSEPEKELYKISIDFWEQTTGYLFNTEMIELYTSSGPAACKDRFVKVISGELESTANTVESEDPIKAFGWRDRFGISAIGQMEVSDPCEMGEAKPAEGTEAYDRWEKAVFKCIDIVFEAGEPACLFVERPIIHGLNSAIVRLRLYDAVDSEGVPHLASGYFFYFDKVNDRWLFSMRRDR